MEEYKLLCELIRKEQFGEEITEEEKSEAVSIFLNGRNNSEKIFGYKTIIKVDPKETFLYPYYYLPPRNAGKKLRLVQGYLPKTNLLYANHYEAEVLRLLVKFAPDNEIVKEMVHCTLKRFDKTCYGNSCTQGECIIAGICVLRFLAAVQPRDEMKISRLLEPLGERFLTFGPGQATLQQGIPLSYLLMAFTDVDNEKTRMFLEQKKDWLLDLLRCGWSTGKLSKGKISQGDAYNLLSKYIIRNAVCTLPEYPRKEDFRIYISETDERCYCATPC